MKYKKTIKQLLTTLVICSYVTNAYADPNELLGLSVEDLLNIDVISVSKKAKSLNDSPAAIFVITQEDIKRIGATSIPDALRLAPGLNVARVDANKWAVTARGFNSRFANKLLVLIDGRTIYTHAFSGVYWENHDVVLEDIERIEVIRGPGATLWGANAVNGVINIITKHSADTQGSLLAIGGGTEEQGFGVFRYGKELSDTTTARVYIKGFNRDNNRRTNLGDKAGDNWDKVQGGFRLDSQLTSHDTFTLQGDAYRSEIHQDLITPSRVPPYVNDFNDTVHSFGGNLLMRQQHTFSSSSDFSFQAFYDFYQRYENFVKEARHVVDLDFHHRFSLLDWNELLWGVGYRYNHDNFIPTEIAQSTPTSRNDQLFSAFLQDEITLIDNALWITLGSKFEHNDYSGFEIQPSARIMWIPHQSHRLWAGISRAVKTPSRAGHSLTFLQKVLPPRPPLIPAAAIILDTNDSYGSENVVSYEIGYRTTLINNVSFDSTAFYSQYNNLLSFATLAPTFNGSMLEQKINFANERQAHTYGFEVATVWQISSWLRGDINYSFFKMEYTNPQPNLIFSTGISPQQSISLRSVITPTEDIDLDILFRYVDSASVSSDTNNAATIKAYTSMDIRLAWRPAKGIEFSLVGQNLLASAHTEYLIEYFSKASKIDRGVFGKLVWQF